MQHEHSDHPIDFTAPAWQEGQDELSFSHRITRHLEMLLKHHNSVEAIDRNSAFSEAVDKTIVSADALMEKIQAAVNEALKQRNMSRARDLSSAKNTIFTLANQARSLTTPSTQTTTDQAAEPAAKDIAPPKVRAPNSQLTRIAEGKEQQAQKSARSRSVSATRNQALSYDPDHRKTRNPQLSAARPNQSTRHSIFTRQTAIFSALALAGILILAAVFARTRNRSASRSETNSARIQNKAPIMKYVVIRDTPAGIVAHPEATDPEGDRVIYAIRWQVSGTWIPGARTARLRPKHYKPGNEVSVEVTPQDAYQRGAPMRSQPITIGSPKRAR